MLYALLYTASGAAAVTRRVHLYYLHHTVLSLCMLYAYAIRYAYAPLKTPNPGASCSSWSGHGSPI